MCLNFDANTKNDQPRSNLVHKCQFFIAAHRVILLAKAKSIDFSPHISRMFLSMALLPVWGFKRCIAY
ncbi:hypothetical protein ANAPC5_01018 [Anaplasma phagocytophilum]|nr:hypothetical protein ANAPC3_01097 [Anaplasma phagocytophilum]SCV64987.1 hypothetical protein ANAPC5_01018 [Anaplasma phagocytophilum]